jgi:hypothetical protein
MPSRACPWAAVVLLAAAASGCANVRSTDTARSAREQLLISNAVDQSLDKVDFRGFRDRAVFFDEKYLDCTDKNYVAGSIRHRLLTSGARLVAKAEEADVVLEARSGSVGTDKQERFVGTPKIELPGPMPVAFPEIKFVSAQNLTATAKIGLVAYDPRTHETYGAGGLSLATSDDNNWFVMGVGPFQSGSVRAEVKEGNRHGRPKPTLPREVAWRSPPESPAAPGTGTARIRLAGSSDETPAPRGTAPRSEEFDPAR